LLHLAARVDEVCRLTWQDIDFKNRTVTRWTKKRRGGSLESIVTYMNNDLYIQLDAIYKNRRNDKWVFYNAKIDDRYRNRRKMLYAICTRAKIDPPIHFHELRHFVASLLANTKDVSKKTISDLLGHKSLSTTEIYLHSIGESKKSAIQSLEGKF
jgi:integrase